MTFPARDETVRAVPPLRRGLPLVVLCTFAAVYAVLALSACLLPAGAGLRNGAGAVAGNDFLTFYAASILVHARMAVEVFDPARFFALQDRISGLSQHFPWAYPPIFLLFVAPLAYLTYLPALFAWVGLTSAAFALLAQRLSRLALPLILIAPPLVQNAADGQNGALSAALMAGAFLALISRRAILAGVLFGLLAYKPQLFLLGPVCLLAAREYRALAALAATVLGLVLVSLVFFGADIWWRFLQHLPDHTAEILSNHLPGGRAPTVFVIIFKLTGSARVAGIAQALATCGAVALVYRVWRGPQDLFARVLAFSIALPLATPVLLEYDLAIWSLPAAMLLRRLWSARGSLGDWLALAVLWLLPSFIWYGNGWRINIWALVIFALVPYVISVERRKIAAAL